MQEVVFESEPEEYFIIERRYQVRGVWKPWTPIGISFLEKYSDEPMAEGRIKQLSYTETAKEAAEYRIRAVRADTVRTYRFSP